MIPGYSWMKFPVLRYAIYLCLGILSYPHINEEYLKLGYFLLPGFLVLYLSFLFIKNILFRSFILGILAFFILFFSGIFLHYYNDPFHNKEHLLNTVENIQGFKGKVISSPKETAKTFRYLIEVKEIYARDSFFRSSGHMILYLRKNDSASLKYGHCVFANASPIRISGPKNPSDFDYRKYMANKNVFHQAFVESEDILVIGIEDSQSLKSLSFKIRSYLLNTLENAISDEENRMIAEALLLGQKEGLKTNVRNAFADTGAVHVLAVSGLHVGIIYQMLIYVFGFLKRIKRGDILLFILSIGILILFALITGLSPSVLRSVIMFSVLAFAALIGRNSAIYNNLGIAALLILLVDPKMIYDLGFQLSFIAVFSIVFFYPKLSSLFEIENLWLERLYKLSCVSISAQIGTVPITLYYFHQFPNVFLLTNILVIPLAGIILSLGLVFFAFHAIPLLNSIISFFLELSIQIMLKGIYLIKRIPFAVTENIHFDPIQLLLSILFLFALIWLLDRKNKYPAYLAGIILILFSMTTLRNIYRSSAHSEMVFFNSRGNHMAQVSGRHLKLNALSKNKDKSFTQYSLEPYLLDLNIHSMDSSGLENAVQNEYGKFWQWKDLVFAFPGEKARYGISPDWIYIDSKNAEMVLDSDYNPVKGFILGNNIPYFIKSKIVEKLNTGGIAYHDLASEGALILK